MFKYECPSCRTRYSSETIPNPAVRKCTKCQQRIEVVLDEESAQATPTPRGIGCGLLLLAVSTLAGFSIGSMILLAAYLFDGKPTAPVPIKEEVASNDLPASPKGDSGSKPDAGAKEKPDPKKDNDPKTEADPKKDSDPKKENDPKKDDDPKKENDPKQDRVLKTDSGSKPDAAALSSDELYNEMLKSCVWIITIEGKNVSWGSGALIDREQKLVLTNQHVANRNRKKIWVFFPILRGGKVVAEREVYVNDLTKEKPNYAVEAEFVYSQTICDLAVIRLKQLPVGVKALRLSRRTIRPGHPLHTVGGNPKGNSGVWIYSSGAVRQVSFKRWTYGDGIDREAEIIASSVSTNPGDSGGAVVDGRGYLAGVHAMSTDGVLNAGHIHVNEVRRFLQTAYRQKLDKEFKDTPDEDAKRREADKVAEWMQKLKAPQSETRKRAADELGKIGPEAQKAAVALLKILRDHTEGEAVRRAAITALREIGPPEHEQFKALKVALEDKREDAYCKAARRYAAQSLESFPEDKRKEALELLKNALKDEDAEVRQNAAKSLASYGKASQESAYEELVECLRDLDAGVRRAAYDTLRAGGVPEEVDLPHATELLQGEKDGKKPTREARYWGVILLVRKFKDKGLPYIVKALEEEANFEDIDFMKYVLDEIGEFKLNCWGVGTILSRALDHRDEHVWDQAIKLFWKLNGRTFGELLTPEENTVEALIKICVKYPKLAVKLEEQSEAYNRKDKDQTMVRGGPGSERREQDAKKNKGPTAKKDGENEKKRFRDHIRTICTTFVTTKIEGLGFQSSPKLVEILIKGIAESDDYARRVAVNCLERIGKDKETAKAAPDLKKALLKEKSAEIRIEILAALASLGKAGGAILGDDKELQEELDKWISDARDDDHTVRVMASLALVSLYPGQPQCGKAYRVLARALLLTNADISVNWVEMTRFGVRAREMRRAKPNSQELELHERAKKALGRGDIVAGEAICTVFESTFWPTPADSVNLVMDRIHARITAFQVLAKIGPPLKTFKKVIKGRPANPVGLLIDKELRLSKVNLEDSRVVKAAREAQVEIINK